MSFEQKNNTGVLFKNGKRESDKHPHATGSCLINGKEYWVSAWTNERDNGDKYQSLAFTLKEEKNKPIENSKSTVKKEYKNFDNFDDDIPF